MEGQLIVLENQSLEEILKPFQVNIDVLNKTLNEVKRFFQEKFDRQKTIIDNLLTRVEYLETGVKFNRHIALMQDRKMDDQEQFSRKVNLKLVGIEVQRNESPNIILAKIKEEVNGLDLPIRDEEYDRCHRIGRKYTRNGKTCQDILIKFCFWRTRDIFYKHRKSFSFKVLPDLTRGRQQLLEYAKEQVNVCKDENAIEQENEGTDEIQDRAMYRVVDYVFIDINCRLKIKSKFGKFYAFNSEAEFFSVISRIDFEDTASSEHMNDESSCDGYY